MRKLLVLAAVWAALWGCSSKKEPTPRGEASGAAPVTTPGSGSQKPATPPPAQQKKYDAVARADFNRWAVRLNKPIYWIADKNDNKALEPDEVAALLYYPEQKVWTQGGAFTADFDKAYGEIAAAAKAPPPDESTPEGKRQKLIGSDLDQGRATLVLNDFAKSSADERAFVQHMLKVGDLTDELYEQMNGQKAFVPLLAKDPASQSLFRRNRGPRCVAPLTEKDPACSAVPPCTPSAQNLRCLPDGSPRVIYDIYPEAMQVDAEFCKKLEKHPEAKALMAPFVVVRGQDKLAPMPYHEAYKPQTEAIAKELLAAVDIAKKLPNEQPLVDYLTAAAKAWTTGDFVAADEAWSKMGVDNSRWYVRSAPDETYWEPCSSKAGPHLTFAKIDQGSRVWQSKLVPVQQDMEAAIAAAAGAPYTARKVTFHLPDFIEIVTNAGNDREALSITIGESLPNWGPVVDQGRGRTVVMTNLYTDPDSRAARRAQAESLLDAASMKNYATDTPQAGLLGTILHEASHNLGPAHEYKVDGKTDKQVFGGPLSSMLEELKAQTGALFLVELLRKKGILSDELAAQSYVDDIVWAFGHISRGMYESDGKPKGYSNLAAIQIGILRDKGALTWDDKATAANGKDKGAFTIHTDKLVPVVEEMMKLVGGIKAKGDKAAAEELMKKYVDSSAVVPHEIIKERLLRFPKQSFVYSVTL